MKNLTIEVFTIKVIAISDTHNQHDSLVLPPCDILIHAGDYSYNAGFEDTNNFARWMKQQKATHRIVVPGNHDKYTQRHTEISRQLFRENSCTMLIDELLEIDGLRIYGSPWTPKFGNWYWAKDRGADIKSVWDNIPYDLDIMISHGPPHGVLDTAIRSNEYVGCEQLRIAVEDKKPKHHIVGHIHFFGGQNMKLGDTIVHNASICNEEYKPLNPITEFEL